MQENGVLEETAPEVNDGSEVESGIKNKEISVNTYNLSQVKCEITTGAKPKRRARSTRRRLNAMMNNTSLHFSDTDSEGELSIISTVARNVPMSKSDAVPENIPHPVISVTIDGIEYQETESTHEENFYFTKERRNSFVDNLTDVDEIYTSEPESQEAKNSERNSLNVAFNKYQGETDVEDLSYEEDEEPSPICIEPRSDILTDFNGETITTKEGYGPFSVEVRNQVGKRTNVQIHSETPDIVVMTNTDSEDFDASDEDDESECIRRTREEVDVLEVLAASQIVMRNINKTENLLNVAKETSDDGINDSYTDVEDLE